MIAKPISIKGAGGKSGSRIENRRAIVPPIPIAIDLESPYQI